VVVVGVAVAPVSIELLVSVAVVVSVVLVSVAVLVSVVLVSVAVMLSVVLVGRSLDAGDAEQCGDSKTKSTKAEPRSNIVGR